MKLTMSLLVCSLVLCVLIPVAQAQSPYDVCASFVSQDDREDCVNNVVEGNTFDAVATNVCGSLGFESDRMECLVQIAGKSCDEGPLSVCAVTPMISEKFGCLDKYCR